MAESFDPYLRWLGIREAERPPNHYRLLGLDLFENDSDVIAVAADRQMAHVRTFQTGQYAPLSQRLLNELAAARICLLKPEKKAAYDALLKQHLGAVPVAARPKGPAVAGNTAANANAASTTSLPRAQAVGSGAGAKRAKAVAGAPQKAEPVDGAAPAEAEAAPDNDVLDLGSFAPTAGIGHAARKSSRPAASKFGPARKRKSLLPWIGLAVAAVLLVIGVIIFKSANEPAQVANADGAGATTTPSASPPNANPAHHTSQPRAVISDKSATRSPPASNPTRGADHNPADRPPVQAGTGTEDAGGPAETERPSKSPLAKNLPPEPPVHPPRDVALVENPPQHDLPDNLPPAQSEPQTPNPKPRAPNPKPRTEPPPKAKLPPVPDKEALAAAEKTILSVYKTDIEQANHGAPDAKAALAKQFIARGMETADNPAARYALLTRARDLAIAGGDVSTATDALKKIADAYAIERPDDQLATCFAALAKTVRTRETADALRVAAESAAERAFAADDFEIAGRFTRLALGMATKLKDPMAVAELKSKLNEIELCKKEFTKISDLLTQLQTDPGNAAANLAVGRFYAFVKGDFDKALPYLAKSSDAALKDVADKDLAAPTAAADQAKLGDAWWALAESNHEPAKSHLQSRAADWYAKAAPNLKGLAKGEVEARLKEIEAMGRVAGLTPRSLIVRMLTENVWTIHFDGNPDAHRQPDLGGFNYPRYHFFADGTAKPEGQPALGHWALEGNVVTVRYGEASPGDGWAQLVHTFRITGDTLHAEQYRLPNVQLINKGIGERVK
ncbi:MAG TPA: hypothetical protein VHX65_11090 [Pirellulales bacterium]|nr:hypothetical protein [Pirellulales bacterium]